MKVAVEQWPNRPILNLVNLPISWLRAKREKIHVCERRIEKIVLGDPPRKKARAIIFEFPSTPLQVNQPLGLHRFLLPWKAEGARVSTSHSKQLPSLFTPDVFLFTSYPF